MGDPNQLRAARERLDGRARRGLGDVVAGDPADRLVRATVRVGACQPAAIRSVAVHDHHLRELVGPRLGYGLARGDHALPVGRPERPFVEAANRAQRTAVARLDDREGDVRSTRGRADVGDDVPPVGRPGRTEARSSEEQLGRTADLDDVQVVERRFELAADERDPASVGRPDRAGRGDREETREVSRPTRVRTDHPDAVLGRKGDPPAVG